MMTSEGAVTDFVVMVKVALVAPPGTTMLNGTSATSKSLVPSWTVTPPGRAALVSVAVPIAGVPPGVVSRSTLSEASGIVDSDTDGLIVSAPVADALPNVAVTFTFAVVDRFAVVEGEHRAGVAGEERDARRHRHRAGRIARQRHEHGVPSRARSD